MYRNCELAIFALNSSKEFGNRVVRSIEKTLTQHVEEEFPDTEVKVCPGPEIENNIRGRDVFVIQSLYGAPGDEDIYRKLVKLLIFNNAAMHASAARITNVIPYLAHARQDRKTKPREPLSGQVVLHSLEDSGADKIIGCTWHSPALQNAVRISCDILDAYVVLADYAMHHNILTKETPISLVAPDMGALKGVIEPLYKMLSKDYNFDLRIAAVDKTRESGENIQSRSFLMGEVEGRTALIIDDESVTGSSINNAAQKVIEKGANKAIGMLAHYKVFKQEYVQKINEGPLEKMIITDTISRSPEFFKQNPKFELCSIAPLIGKAIMATHYSESISHLYEL